ncbi:MAG: hypothetical protein EBU70_07370 [Actinobacteria bacterium]|nr:hypothetical protein [Actinomycetota bacterium]
MEVRRGGACESSECFGATEHDGTRLEDSPAVLVYLDDGSTCFAEVEDESPVEVGASVIDGFTFVLSGDSSENGDGFSHGVRRWNLSCVLSVEEGEVVLE